MKSSHTRAEAWGPWTVGDVMTPQPLTIGRKESLEKAHRMMREHRVRHLPVLEHGELIGILSQRDLYFLETIRGVEVEEDLVEDAMTPDAYVVSPGVPVAAVAKQMARRRLGCAVVVERGRVAGIFTATDGLRLLSALAPQLSPEDGERERERSRESARESSPRARRSPSHLHGA